MEKLNFVDHTKNIIEIKNVSFAYDAKNNVLENINLEIHRGDYIGLVGPNGGGKTTLIKIILGLLKSQGGSISFFGSDICDFKNWQKIGYVPQQINNFDKNFPSTVSEVVMMAYYSDNFFWQKDEKGERVLLENSLKAVNMWNFRDRLIGDLSGGQMQRVFIARALINQPEIIFLDEPVTGIDEKNQKEFYQLMQKLNKEMKITLVMVSHDIARVTQEVMHMVCVDKTLVCHSTPQEYIDEIRSSSILGEEIKIINHHHKHN